MADSRRARRRTPLRRRADDPAAPPLLRSRSPSSATILLVRSSSRITAGKGRHALRRRSRPDVGDLQSGTTSPALHSTVPTRSLDSARASASARHELRDHPPAFVDPGLEALLIDNGVEISAEPIPQGNGWVGVLLSFAPALLIIGLYVWFFRRAAKQGGGLGGALTGGLGKSSARRFDQEAEGRVTFEDVAGIDEAENELVEIVDFLRNPEKYTRSAGPRGVLLVGPPGTGKTLLARAVAGEAGVPFFSMSASEFVEMIVGVGAARVRDLFKQAREHAPAIIFIDELDSIGRARGAVAVGGSSEQEQTLNQILTEMDGFSSPLARSLGSFRHPLSLAASPLPAIAWMYKEDYGRPLSDAAVIEPDGRRTVPPVGGRRRGAAPAELAPTLVG